MSSINNPQGQETSLCFLCQNESASSNYLECKVENNLKVIFLMRELLGISFDLCANYLQKYGDPSSWIHLCSHCLQVVYEGHQLFKKIKQLEKQLQGVKTKVRCQAKVKSELDIVPEAGKEIRKDFLEHCREEQENTELASMEYEILPELEQKYFNIKLEVDEEEFLENPYENLEEVNMSQNNVLYPTKSKKKTRFKTKKKSKKIKKIIKVELPKRRGLPRKINQKSNIYPLEIDPLLLEDNDYSLQAEKEEDSDSSFHVEDDDSFGEEKDELFIGNDEPTSSKPRTHRKRGVVVKERIKEAQQVGFSCPYESCNKIFPKKEHFEDHYRIIHLPESAITCGGCKLAFQLKLKYKVHLENATEDSCIQASLKCSECDVNTSSQEALDIHIKFNHSIPNPDLKSFTEEAAPKSLQSKDYLCPEESCGQLFSIYTLENHVRKIHLPPSTLICFGCNEKILEHKRYNAHLETNKDCSKAALKCPQCSIHSQSKEALDLHIKINHFLSSPYKCDVCDKLFKTKGGLSRHMQQHDITDQKAFICEKCGAGFPMKRYLHRHMKKIHGPDQKFACRMQCGKEFRNSYHRNRHEKLHVEGNPYQCTECGKCFKMKNYLTIHMWTHDPDRHLKYSLYKSKGLDKTKYKRGSGTNQRVKVIPSSSTTTFIETSQDTNDNSTQLDHSTVDPMLMNFMN